MGSTTASSRCSCSSWRDDAPVPPRSFMDAPTPPAAKPTEREPRPRRGYRAVPVVLGIVLLAINVGLTGRVVWRLERPVEAARQPATLAEIVEGLARTAKEKAKAEKLQEAAATRDAFAFDSLA